MNKMTELSAVSQEVEEQPIYVAIIFLPTTAADSFYGE
jgi:hypothetical protein